MSSEVWAGCLSVGNQGAHNQSLVSAPSPSPFTTHQPRPGVRAVQYLSEGAFGVFSLRLKTKSKCPAPRVRSSKLKKKKIWNWPCPELVRSKACFKHLLSLQSWRWYVKIVTAPLSARHRAVIQCSDCQGLRGIELETKVHGVFLYVVLEERPYYGILFVLPTSSFTHKNLLRHYAKRALNKPWWLKIGTLTQIS